MRTLISLLTVAGGFYFLLALMLDLFQGKMVFLANLPGRALKASPNDIAPAAAAAGPGLATAAGDRASGNDRDPRCH